MSIAREWADYCSDLTYAELPSEVVDYAKDLLLDYLGVTFGGGYFSPSAETFIDGVQALESCGPDEGGGTIVPTGERMSPSNAALLNGALAHSLDFDDTEKGHPGSPVISAALATSESRDADGTELLTAIVAGYEVYCRLVRAVNTTTHYECGFHPTATCGVFGATAAAGTARGLNTAELVNAFGLNASQASGTHGYIKYGGWNKRAHPGLAAHSAIIATSLASAGFQGTPEPIEGYRNFLHAYAEDPDPAAATAALNEIYLLPKTGIKPYPCCRGMHTAVDLALAVRREGSVSAASIENVRVETPTSTVGNLAEPDDVKRRPETLIQAQFSLPFGVALGLARGDAGLTTFQTEIEGGYGDDIQRLINRMTVRSTSEMDEKAAEEGKRPARLVVETESNRYERSADFSRGDPQNPLSNEELRSKFDELTVDLPADVRNTVIERVRNLECHRTRTLLDPVEQMH